MCRNGAECTTAEASAVHVDGMPDHLIGGNPFSVVAGMWHSGVGQVERLIHFRLCHWRIHGVDLYRHIACGLPNGVAVPTVGLYFDMLEVFGLMFLLFRHCSKECSTTSVSDCFGMSLFSSKRQFGECRQCRGCRFRSPIVCIVRQWDVRPCRI